MIPNYNGEAFLGRCLDSLAQQSCLDFELMVIDNGSQDGSLRILKEHPLQPKIIQLDKNLGFPYAVNLGIEQAQAELIALLNNDAFAEGHWLENLLRSAEQNPEMDFFACLILQAEAREKIESAGVSYTLQARPLPILENQLMRKELKAKEVFLASGAGVLFGKKLTEEIGKFDPDYFAYLEDIDFFFRARLAGARGMLVPDALIYHFGAGTALHDRPGPRRMESGKRVYLIARNRWYLVWDNLPWVLILLLGPLILWGWLRGMFYHLFKSGQFWHFLCGSFAGFFSFPRRRKKRIWVRRLRRVNLRELLSWMRKGVKELG